MGVLNIGASALQAAYAQMQTTSHNIANASTPGYSRQETRVAATLGSFQRGMFLGGGVEVSGVERQYDAHLNREVHAASSAQSSDAVRSMSLSRLESLFANSENGLGVLHDNFNAGLADLVNQPFDRAARAVTLQQAGALASKIDETDQALDRMRNDTDLHLRQLTQTVNADLKSLASINSRLAAIGGTTYSPNDLLDQRDAMIEKINKSLKTNSHINGDGSVSLFSAAGNALVLAEDATTLSLVPDPRDAERMNLTMSTDGVPVIFNDAMLGGGEIAGAMAFRNHDLVAARTELGRFAGAVADAYNRQQSLGVDSNGNAGAALFTAGAARVVQGTANTGNATFDVQVIDGRQLAANDYRISLVGGQYQVSAYPGGEPQTIAGWPLEIDGLEVSIASGAMAEGDTVVLKTASAFAGKFAVAMQSGDQWATAQAVIPVMGKINAGSLTVADFRIVQADPNMKEPVELVFDGAGNFSVTGTGTGNPVSVPYTPGEPIRYNGWELTLGGDPALIDRISIRPPVDNEANNGNARALLNIGTDNVVGGDTPSGAFGSMISTIGGRAFRAENDLQQSTAWQQSAVGARDSVSGVNLDEEAARLIQYQQAYQAAAKVIATSQDMFDTLMSVSR